MRLRESGGGLRDLDHREALRGAVAFVGGGGGRVAAAAVAVDERVIADGKTTDARGEAAKRRRSEFGAGSIPEDVPVVAKRRGTEAAAIVAIIAIACVGSTITCGTDGQTPKLQTHARQGARGQTFQSA